MILIIPEQCNLTSALENIADATTNEAREYFPGDLFQYTCVPGYLQAPGAIPQCTGDGNWTLDAAPDCFRRKFLVDSRGDIAVSQ